MLVVVFIIVFLYGFIEGIYEEISDFEWTPDEQDPEKLRKDVLAERAYKFGYDLGFEGYLRKRDGILKRLDEGKDVWL